VRNRLLILSIFLFALGFGAFASTRDHWWCRVRLRSVNQRGSQGRIELWRSATGNLLVAQNNRELYFVAPQLEYIGVPNGSELTSFAVVAFTRHGPPLCVSMPSAKIHASPHLAIRNGLLAFNRMDGSRIELRY